MSGAKPDLRVLIKPLAYMAGVVDEFGSLLGAVALDDVLEAIAGEIAEADEGSADNEKRPFERAGDGAYLIPGRQPLDDIVEARLLKQPAQRNDKTMAGFVIAHLGRIPREGEVIELPKVSIEVGQVKDGAVEQLRLTPKDEAPKKAKEG